MPTLEAVFVIDDHVELVGNCMPTACIWEKKDMPVAEARKILGRNYLIGGTANTLADVESLYAGADYVRLRAVQIYNN